MFAQIVKNAEILGQFKCFMACSAVALACTCTFFPELAQAATTVTGAVKGDKELGAALQNITGLVAGNVGKIIAIVSFMFGLMGSIFKFNPAAIGGSFGVALAAGLGPQAIEAVVGATF